MRMRVLSALHGPAVAAALALLSSALAPASSRAQDGTITSNPPNPILGAAVTYTYTPPVPSWNIQTIYWDYQWTGNCSGAWTALSSTPL